MEDAAIEARVSVRDAVALLSDVHRRHVWRLAVVRGLWVGLALIVLCFYSDAVLQWGAGMRLILNLGTVAAALATVVLTRWRLNRAVSRDKMLARLIETEHPEIGNDLTNAIDFENRLDGHCIGGSSPALMRKGIERATESFDQLSALESLKPPTLRREYYVLAGVLAAWVLSALLFSRWMFAELPRFLSPFADHPPYSATQLIVDPAGAMVDYGKALTVKVIARGRTPEGVSLLVRNPDERQVNKIPMFKSQDGSYFQTIEDIRSDLVYWAGVEHGRSKYHRVTLCKTPRIETVRVHYRYPAYSRLVERNATLSESDNTLKAYKGTEVTMDVASNRPLAGGTLNVSGHAYTCAGQPENTAQAVFPLTEQGDFSVSITDVEGNVSTSPFKGKVTIVPDNRPMISIVSPAVQSLATPTAKVPIVIEAQDDLGISDVSLFRSLNESDDARKHLVHEANAGVLVSVTDTLDLADLGVRPGDEIDFYATATDSLPESPQTIASEPYKLQIISDEQYAQMMQDEMTARDLRLKYDSIISQMDQLVAAQEQLAREMQALEESLVQAGSTPLSQTSREKLQDIEQRQQALAKKAASLARKLAEESRTPPVFDIEKDYKQFLADFSEKTTAAGGHMANSAREMKDASQTGAERLVHASNAVEEQTRALEILGAQTQEMKDKIQQANREIERIITLMADVEMFKVLYVGQKHLTRETKSYSEVEAEDLETRVRLKELAERETSIQKGLETLKNQFREHGEEVRQDYPKVADDARKIADEIEQRKIPDLMQAGAAFLNRGSGVQGYPNVVEALKQMAAMISFCESAGGKGCRNCELRLRIQMMLNPGNTMGQLAQGLGMGMGEGTGMGLVGAFGRGASGYGGGRSSISVFGNDTFGKDMQPTESSVIPGVEKAQAQTISLPARHDLSGNIEELTPQSKRDDESNVAGDSRMMAEYRQLIEAYFRKLAEDK
ncbi:MAG: hypothetical protein JW955_25560 [Sedimentisphaerales bacterium]|nr:hypothetical protein [Sedimentisphaerales bacterium]